MKLAAGVNDLYTNPEEVPLPLRIYSDGTAVVYLNTDADSIDNGIPLTGYAPVDIILGSKKKLFAKTTGTPVVFIRPVAPGAPLIL